MPEMGRYCKAYLVKDLAEFDGWEPDLTQLRPGEPESGGGGPQPRDALSEDDILYIQEDGIVTDGIFRDQFIVFDRVSPEWQAFCAQTLVFAPPSAEEDSPLAATEAVPPA